MVGGTSKMKGFVAPMAEQLKQMIQEELAGVLGERMSPEWNPWDDLQHAWQGGGGEIGPDAEGNYGTYMPSGEWLAYEVPGGGMVPDKLEDDPNKEDLLSKVSKGMTTHHDPKPAEKYWYSREDDEVYRGKGAGIKPQLGDPKLAPKVGGTSKMPRQTMAPMKEQLKQIIMQELAGVLLEKEDPIEPAEIPNYIAGLKSQAAGGEVSAGMAMSTLQAIVDAAEENPEFGPLAMMAAQALEEIPKEAEKAAKDAVKV
jgi:hypothetical protein